MTIVQRGRERRKERERRGERQRDNVRGGKECERWGRREGRKR